jgi:hypothetical protein
MAILHDHNMSASPMRIAPPFGGRKTAKLETKLRLTQPTGEFCGDMPYHHGAPSRYRYIDAYVRHKDTSFSSLLLRSIIDKRYRVLGEETLIVSNGDSPYSSEPLCPW